MVGFLKGDKNTVSLLSFETILPKCCWYWKASFQHLKIKSRISPIRMIFASKILLNKLLK